MEKKENVIQVIEEKEITQMLAYGWLSLSDSQKANFVEDILLNLITGYKVKIICDYISKTLSIGAIYDIMGWISQLTIGQYNVYFEVTSVDSFIAELVD